MTPPPRLLTTAARWSRGRQATVVAVLLCGAALVDPNRPLPIDLCMWRRLTGFPCPTCGLTRAICHALRGDLGASLSLHPAGVLVIGWLAGWALWSALEAWRGQPIHERARNLAGLTLLRASVAVSAIAWLIRLASGVSV